MTSPAPICPPSTLARDFKSMSHVVFFHHYCRTRLKWAPLCTESPQFLMIKETQWDCPDQCCCPCADKWLPLSKGPTHLDKQFHHENTFNKYLLINVLSKFKPGLLVCRPDTVHAPQNLWQADTWETRFSLSLMLRYNRFLLCQQRRDKVGLWLSKFRNKKKQKTPLLQSKSPSEFISRNRKN